MKPKRPHLIADDAPSPEIFQKPAFWKNKTTPAIFFVLLFLSFCTLSACSAVGGEQPAADHGQQQIVQTEPPTASLSPTFTSQPSLTPTLPPTATNTPLPTSTAAPVSTPTFAPGATQVSPQDRMLLVYAPAGEFFIGSKPQASGADYDEMPRHPVYLDAFWIYKTTVTNAMYADFLNEMGNQVEGRATWLNAASPNVLLYQSADGVWHPREGYENHPAVEVTWYGANAYCQWAGLRLPTEAEWEKAARGTDGRRFPWGDEIDCEHAQYANCRGGLQPVGSKPAGASPYGALDMAGNVWEWVADWYADDYYANSPYENPPGPESGRTRVLRGGSWDYNWKHQLSADRRHNG
ncbi:MAG TPA: hypothetical protein EYP88_01915, partial [Anaerolineales bacterium]|nr:hypothetical protein [Anaerolineales bacterium]